MSGTHLKKDFMGRMVCEHCWCGMHEMYKTDRATNKTTKVPNCLGYGCECLCNERNKEKPCKPKPSKRSLPAATFRN